MATLALGTDLTLAEIMRRETPDGKVAQVVDVVKRTKRIFEDATWIECNSGTFHEDTRTVTKPGGALRSYDEGVAKEAGVTEKVVEPTCMLAGISEVDCSKLIHSPDENAMRRLEWDVMFLDGMLDTLVENLFDGNRGTDARSINGINVRTDYNTLQTTETRVFDNAGGNCADASVFTSIYFVQWGFGKVNLIYPRNNPVGGGTLPIKMEDFGKVIASQSGTSDTKKYPVYQTWFSCDFGLFIHDPRCIKRICNIAVTDNAPGGYFVFDEEKLIDAYNQLEYEGEGVVGYCNRTLFAQMQKRANKVSNSLFTNYSEGEGPFARPVTRFMGIEIKRVDAITNTQADVTT